MYKVNGALFSCGITDSGRVPSREGDIQNFAYTGWPRKNATPTINNFKKKRDKMEKLCALMHIKKS